MQYAVKHPDGSVSVVDTVPRAVKIGAVEFPVTFFERTNNGAYLLTYYDSEAERPVTRTFGKNDKALIFPDIDSVMRKTGKAYTDAVPVEGNPMLDDRTFRDAWTIVSNRLETDMAKARDIHRNHIRAARKPQLEAADVEYFKALEASVANGLAPESAEYVALEQAAAAKKKLRDMPAMPEIETAQTPETLKRVWPAELGPNPWV